jgi:hypothetical protein
MDRKDIAAGLFRHCGGINTVNTHSHHMRDPGHLGFGLSALLDHSYVSWVCLPPRTKVEREEYIRRVRNNSYFRYLELSLRELYAIDKRLDENTWDVFDQAVTQAHKDEKHHLRLLTDTCCYSRVINDSYWDPGSSEGHPEIFSPAFRVNMFFYGYSPDARDHNGNNPFRVYGWDEGMGFDEYLDRLDAVVAEKKSAGCVALKSALAYDRGLGFRRMDKAAAQKAFGHKDAVPEDICAFQDYIYYEFCRICAKYGLPFQNHTGLGILDETNALRLREAVAANPDTSFCLFHGSYPWTGDVTGLVHNYPNVYADLCWMPLISPSACGRLVRELVEVGTAGTMMWGCDTWTGEESYGALLAVRETLADSFAGMVADRCMTLNDAEEFIARILGGNARALFDL